MSRQPGAEPSDRKTCRLRIDEVIGLCLVTMALIEVCSHFFGLRDPLSIVIVAIGCASYPAQRLLQVRRFGTAAARSADIYAAVAMTPFMLLPVVHALYPGAAIWQPAMPQMTRYVGMALALGLAVPRAAWTGLQPASLCASSMAGFSRTLPLLMLSVLLIASSGVVALLTLYGLAAGVLGGPGLARRKRLRVTPG